jgi:hypothetical protein
MAQDDKPASVAGSVNNSATGEPVVRAQVRLEMFDNGKSQAYGATTDAEGKFRVTGMLPGMYNGSAQRTGYVTPRETVRVGVRAGDRKDDLKLKLVPAGAISGRVLDADGDPVEGISVTIEGSGSGPSVQGGVSDDRGRYRIGGLMPRQYRVRAMPVALPIPPEIRSDGTAEAIYGPTFYPGSVEARTAVKVEVKPGEEVMGADIRLVRIAPVRVRGTVAGVPPGVRPVVDCREPYSIAAAVGVRSDNTFEVWRLPPGKYTLQAHWDTGGLQVRTAPVEIEVAQGNIENLELKVVPPSDVAGAVTFDDDAAKQAAQPAGPTTAPGGPPQKVQALPRISLREIDGGTAPLPADVHADGTFHLAGVQPGRYRVTLSGQPGHVKSMQLGQVQFEGNLLDLRNGSAGQPLGVLVSSEKGEISGTVTRNDVPVRARVALVWADAGIHEQTVAITIAEADGKYHLSVAPGRYKLAAVEEDDAMLWDRIEDYEDALVSVDLHAGDQLTLDLKRK